MDKGRREEPIRSGEFVKMEGAQLMAILNSASSIDPLGDFRFLTVSDPNALLLWV